VSHAIARGETLHQARNEYAILPRVNALEELQTAREWS